MADPLPWDSPDADPLRDVIEQVELLKKRPPMDRWPEYWLHCESCWNNREWGSAVFFIVEQRDRYAALHTQQTGHEVTKEDPHDRGSHHEG